MYGLKRIIQIDGYVAGKETVIDVDGHSILDGTNGAGKSTTLRLLPFFYGSDPSNMDDQASNREPFVQFYLPRPTSIIVFEYVRETGLCCAVVSRHKSGAKHVYRFLEAGYSKERFSRKGAEEQYVYCQGRELKNHWGQLGLSSSTQIDVVTDYRAIIQNDTTLINRLSDSRSQRQLAAKYCLGSRNTRMRHIERICSSIASANGNLERMKDMLADIMLEDGVVFPSPPIHKSDAHVADEIRSIRKFDNEKREIRKAISLGRERGEAISVLRSQAAALDGYAEIIGNELSGYQADRDAKDGEIRNANREHAEKYEELERQRATAEANQQSLSNQLDSLHQRYSEYEDADMEDLAADYDNLPAFQEIHRVADKRYQGLISDVQVEERDYQQQLMDEQRRYTRRKEKTQANLDAQRQELQQAQFAHIDEQNNLRQGRDEEKEAVRQSREDERESLAEQRAKASNAAEYGGESEEERAALATAEALVDGAKYKVARLTKDAEGTSVVLTAAEGDLDDANKATVKARQRQNQEQVRLDEIHNLLFAEDGTWLKVLRDQDPDWANRLGKVINPALLMRKDLAPELIQSSEGVFGWRIDLDVLQSPRAAESEDQLRSQFTAAEDALRIAKNSVEDCEAAALKAGKRVKAASKVHDVASQEVHVAAAERESAELFVQEEKRRINQAISDRRLYAKGLVGDLTQQIDALKEAMKDALSDLDKRYAGSLQGLKGSHSLEESRLSDNVARLEDDIAQEKENHKERNAQYKSDFNKLCSDNGIDDKTVAEAKAERDRAKSKVEDLLDSAQKVAIYLEWMRTEWSRQTGVTAELETLNAKVAQCYQAINDEKLAHGNKKRALQAQLSDITKKIGGAQSKDSSIKLIAPRLDVFRTLGEAPPADLPFELLLKAISDKLDAYDVTRAELLSIIDRVDTAIDGYGETQISRAWARTKDDWAHRHIDAGRDRASEAFRLLLPDALETFIDSEFDAIKAARIESVRTIGKGLSDFFERLGVVDKGIRAQSRSITRTIGENMEIDALSGIKLILSSRVEELEYWSALQDFYEPWEEWRKEGEASLPPEQMIEDMHVLIGTLQGMRAGRNLRDYFDLQIQLTENGRNHVCSTEAQLKAATSTGLQFLVLCSIFIAITRALCSDKNTIIHWPVDELGQLAPENITRLFSMLNAANISMVGGFPSQDPMLLRHFKHRQVLSFKEGVQVVKIPRSTLKDRVQVKRTAGDAA